MCVSRPRVQKSPHVSQGAWRGAGFSPGAWSERRRFSPPLYVNLVGAGEASGALPEILLRLVKHLMQAKNLRDRVQMALIYPTALALAGIVLITIFITFMVPQLTAFMTQNNAVLPLPTRILLGVHHAFAMYWWLGIIIVIGIMAGFRMFVRTPEGRITWDRFRLSVP